HVLLQYFSLLSFLLQRYGAHRDLHSFPTRRSSDLRRTSSRSGSPRARPWTSSCPKLLRWCARRLSARWGSATSTSRSWAGQRCIDRKSTRLNSSHVSISYAVFCLKKKKEHL